VNASPVERQVAVNLARRHVVEAGDATPARRLEQRLRAERVGAEEAAGIEDGEAVVRLRREVDDDLDLLVREHAFHELEVADVASTSARRTRRGSAGRRRT
jgi:hypothetical protein